MIKSGEDSLKKFSEDFVFPLHLFGFGFQFLTLDL